MLESAEATNSLEKGHYTHKTLCDKRKNDCRLQLRILNKGFLGFWGGLGVTVLCCCNHSVGA